METTSMETILYWTRETLEFVLMCLVWLSPIWLSTLVLALVPPLRWYIAWLLAKRDLIFTMTPESYFKIATRFGGYRKTLLSKKGYTINKDGDITKLPNGTSPETSPLGGLGLVGLPGIDRIYKKEMRFSKSMPDGTIKEYDVPDVSAFLAKVDYPYALPFVKCEDKNNLPLEGHATLLAHIVNPEKSLFAAANFYDTMVGLVLPVVRECLEGFTFDQIKERKDDLDDLMWKELNEEQPDGAPSVIETLRDKYGVCIIALRIVNIDPPKEYRDATLTKWKAKREADAATHQAEASATLFDDTNQALKIWLESQRVAGHDPTQAQIDAKQEELYQRALAKTPGYQHIRIKGLEGATTAVVGGGNAGIMIGTGKGNPGGGSRGRKKKNPTHLEEADDDDAF